MIVLPSLSSSPGQPSWAAVHAEERAQEQWKSAERQNLYSVGIRIICICGNWHCVLSDMWSTDHFTETWPFQQMFSKVFQIFKCFPMFNLQWDMIRVKLAAKLETALNHLRDEKMLTSQMHIFNQKPSRHRARNIFCKTKLFFTNLD